MPQRDRTRSSFLIGLAAVAALVAAPARPAEPQASARSLAGQVLVATQEMQDPRFAGAVIYMVRHDETGALGVVVNRPLRDVSLALLLQQTGIDSKGAQGTVRLHAGGPVETRRIFVLHTADYTSDSTVSGKNGIALTWEPDILRAIADGKGPRRVLFAVGYAGWGSGQLDAEMKAGVWVRASADEALIFDSDYDTKWDRAMSRRKIDL
ncbi:MAG TPA: YqgE/AlgH family protein [Candidatus Methylomirabilis sp.]|nr:YqgE/AlgH family protein [Candidatus Methylomirabilis sp.]